MKHEQTISESVSAISETIVLYRPVGPKELELIAASRYRDFPPRLPGQPIFYPVTLKISNSWLLPTNIPERP